MRRRGSSTPSPFRALRLDVPGSAAGERLDRFLGRALPAGTARVARLVAEGRVRIRGRTCSPLRRLFGGEELEIRLPAPAAASPEPSGTAGHGAVPPPTVLYQDGDVLVVDKPSGLAVEAGGPNAPGVVEAARDLARLDAGGRALPGLPHRLDRDTTGCLLLARTDAALERLRQAFAGKRVEKEYLAIVEGTPPDRGALDTPYARDPADRRRFTTRVPSPRRARLSFRVERRLAGAALVRVILDTGRTHQIRVQLAEAGWPVLGDSVYGRPSPVIARQALHAVRLAFPRPSDGSRVEVAAPVPLDVRQALARLAP